MTDHLVQAAHPNQPVQHTGAHTATDTASHTALAARWLTQLTLDDIPADVRSAGKLRLLDTLGCLLAAAAQRYGAVMRRSVSLIGGQGPSHVLGFTDRVAPVGAALANGMLAHALVFDDTHVETIVHPSSTVMAAAFAMAQAKRASGAAFLLAYHAGVEMTCRIGLAAPRQFHPAGFQPTAIVAPLGAAFATSSLCGLDATTTTCAVGLSGSFASGIIESWTDGTWAHLVHPGWAAHSAVSAAFLAQSGYSGPAAVLEGRFGVFRTHVQKPGAVFTFERVTEQLGTLWQSRNMSLKPYPCGHVIHPFLDALLALHREGLRPAHVKRITCRLAAYMIPVVCLPVDEKRRPSSDAQARTSLQFSLAEALRNGTLDGASFGARSFSDPVVLALADCIECEVDADAPDSRAYKGWVIVDTVDGRRLERIVPNSRGGKDNPMTEHEIIAKFRHNAGMHLPAARLEPIIEMVQSLEQQPSMDRLAELCAVAEQG